MERIDRRTFLAQSGKAFAMTAAGLTLLPARGSKYSQNDTIGVAVIGFNGQGGSHIRNYLEMAGTEVVALCDADERVLARGSAQVQQKMGKAPKLYTDIRQLLEDKNVDVVTTATPNHWHALATIWACQAGKDVYVEKPACWGFHEGEMMVQAARKYNRIVQVGHQTRSDRKTRNAIQRAWAGEIGEVYMVRGLCYKPRLSIGMRDNSAPPSGLHWDLWQGPAPRREFNPSFVHYNWHWFWEYGNGDIGNQGVHQMDVARWFMRKRLPVSVHSTGGRYGYKDQGETPNTQISTFQFEDGKVLVFEVRGLLTNDEQGEKIGNLIYGSTGYMSSGDDYKPRSGPETELSPKDLNLPTLNGTGDGSHHANFIAAVRSRKLEDLHCEVEEGVLSAQLCHLANVSYRLGRSLKFDPVKKQFVGDKEANTLLRRNRPVKGFEIGDRV